MPKMIPLNAREAKAWDKCPHCIRYTSFIAAGLHFTPHDATGRPFMRNGDGKTSRDPGWSADLYLKPSRTYNGWDCWIDETRVCLITNLIQLRAIIKLLKKH